MALFLLWITVPYAVAGRGVCRIASGQIAGRETTLLKEAGDMLRFVPSAVTLGTIAGIVAFFGAAFFLIPGFISGGVLSLALPAGAAESIGPFAALRLAVSAAWRVFGRVVLLFLAYSALVFAAWVSQGIAFTAVPQFFEVFAIRTLIYLVCSFIPIVPLALLQICFTLLYLEARRPIQVPAAVRA